jgi:hypothetical protein
MDEKNSHGQDDDKSNNCYSSMRKFHMVKTMIIILYTKRIINESLGKPKNLFPLKM